MINDDAIEELQRKVRSLEARCQAAEFAVSLIAAALPPESKQVISETFEKLMQDHISRLTDDEARANSEITDQLRLLLRSVLKQSR